MPFVSGPTKNISRNGYQGVAIWLGSDAALTASDASPSVCIAHPLSCGLFHSPPFLKYTTPTTSALADIV